MGDLQPEPLNITSSTDTWHSPRSSSNLSVGCVDPRLHDFRCAGERAQDATSRDCDQFPRNGPTGRNTPPSRRTFSKSAIAAKSQAYTPEGLADPQRSQHPIGVMPMAKGMERGRRRIPNPGRPTLHSASPCAPAQIQVRGESPYGAGQICRPGIRSL